MSVIKDLNRFVKNPISLDVRRSKFKRPFGHKTTFKAGDLVPIFLDEVLPGDTFKLDVSSVVRMLTPAVPVMDNCFLDIYFFYVPNRLCTFHSDDWQKICGENKGGYWAPAAESTLSNTGNMITITQQAGFEVKYDSVAAYLGLPVGNWKNEAASSFKNFKFSTMPFVAYIKIWNEFFRDQNTQAPVACANAGDIMDYFASDSCLKVNKLHDYFCSALPAPQKGDSVVLPIAGEAPVLTSSVTRVTGSQAALRWSQAVDGEVPELGYIFTDDQLGTTYTHTEAAISGDSAPIYPENLYANLKNAAFVTVNELRQSVAIQRMLEKDARGGTRYREMLKAHFGVTVPDMTVQVPEYLAGKRVPLNITQVLQTSETSTTPLGTTGAFSNTGFQDKMFTKSFSECGYVVGVCCVRNEQSYSQGVHKLWTRDRRYDFYDPSFANLGEMPIYKRELYLPHETTSGAPGTWDVVFGYQEAWAEYRYHPTQISGALAPNANQVNFTAWTYTNNFTASPTLNSTFMKQPSSQIGDTLVVTTTKEQFVADFYFDLTCARVMPLYSIPGLMDHH